MVLVLKKDDQAGADVYLADMFVRKDKSLIHMKGAPRAEDDKNALRMRTAMKESKLVAAPHHAAGVSDMVGK